MIWRNLGCALVRSHLQHMYNTYATATVAYKAVVVEEEEEDVR